MGACPASNLCYAVDNSSPFGDGSTVTGYTATGKNGAGVTVPAALVISDIACPAARTCVTASACYAVGVAGTIEVLRPG